VFCSSDVSHSKFIRSSCFPIIYVSISQVKFYLDRINEEILFACQHSVLNKYFYFEVAFNNWLCGKIHFSVQFV
jgi:hypothetical protein